MSARWQESRACSFFPCSLQIPARTAEDSNQGLPVGTPGGPRGSLEAMGELGSYMQSWGSEGDRQPRRMGCLCGGEQVAGKASGEEQGSQGAPPASPWQLKLAGLKLIGYNLIQRLEETGPGPTTSLELLSAAS